MPDPSSALPAPKPCMIIKSIEDLSTLYSCLTSVTVSQHCFEESYCQITEAVLSNFVPYLQQLLHTIMRIRSDHISIREDINTAEKLGNFLPAESQKFYLGTLATTNTSVFQLPFLWRMLPQPFTKVIRHRQRLIAFSPQLARYKRSLADSLRCSLIGSTISSPCTLLTGCTISLDTIEKRSPEVLRTPRESVGTPRGSKNNGYFELYGGSKST